MTTSIRLALAAAAACVAAAPASTSGQPLPSAGTAAFDLAGVKLGMTPDEALQELAKARYRIIRTSQLQSFREQVAARVDELRRRPRLMKNDAIAGIDAQGPATERVGVEFDQWPDGPRVVRVVFIGNPDSQPQDAFRTQVEAKYGRPTMWDGGHWRWCAPRDRGCQPMSNATLPTFDADYQLRALTLNIGGDALDARAALVEAEARKIVPLTSRSAF